MLHFAAKKAYVGLVDDLLQAGAQLNHRDDKDLNVLDYASMAFNATRSRKRSRNEAANAMKSLLNIFSRMPGEQLLPDKEVAPEEVSRRFESIKQKLAVRMLT